MRSLTILFALLLSVGCGEGKMGGAPDGDAFVPDVAPSDSGDNVAPSDSGDNVAPSDSGDNVDSCPFHITEYPPLGKARLLAAYKICPSCHANLDEYLFLEHGRPAAYLYEDGLFLYRNEGPPDFVHRFQQRTLTQTQACTLLDGVDLDGLADEASTPGTIMYRGSVDAKASVVYLRNQGAQFEVDLNGSVHDDFGLTPESSASAANSARLALNLSTFAQDGALYHADTLGLWVTADVEHWCPKDPDLPGWPFDDIPLEEMHDKEHTEKVVPVVLEGDQAEEVRAWALAQQELSPCSRLAAVHEGVAWRIILVDLPPDGYDGHPVSPCWTTGC